MKYGLFLTVFILFIVLIFTPISYGINEPTCIKALWLWPVQPKIIVNDFSPPAQKWLAGHRGIDLLSSDGGIIIAPENGTISFSGEVALKPVVTIRIKGFKATFEPAITILPIGTPVTKGMPIATVVSPDTYINHCEPATCVHWGIKNDAGDYFDPKDYADAKGPIVILEMK
ncbi:MAG: M23 family peptidase [Bifidobacteriaceae bacterium]|jgi:hypothetical protein|nr:M23 family peptidase [Bifidobacteriaceae bacterium]